MDYPQLKLENQICFPLYAVSRFITQQYKPLLDELGVTYPQYLVLLVLWENDNIPVKVISEKLQLETNTLTPLLKRMEAHGFINRRRSKTDERMVSISLTSKGRELEHRAANVPAELTEQLDCLNLKTEDVVNLKTLLDRILDASKKA